MIAQKYSTFLFKLVKLECTHRAVDSILKLGGPSSKESVSNEGFYNFYLQNAKETGHCGIRGGGHILISVSTFLTLA